MATWENLVIDALPIDLAAGDYERALELAAHEQRIKAEPGRVKEKQFSRHWSPYAIAWQGRLAEAAFARYLGVAYSFAPRPSTSNHQPDVGGYEVKSSCWGRLESQIEWDGGRCPTGGGGHAPIVYLCQYQATVRQRAYLVGWIPRSLALGWKGIPVDHLASWRTLKQIPGS